jgi:hypothetical protein
MNRRVLLRELVAYNDRLAQLVENVEAGETRLLRGDLLGLSEDFDAFVIAYEEGSL